MVQTDDDQSRDHSDHKASHGPDGLITRERQGQGQRQCNAHNVPEVGRGLFEYRGLERQYDDAPQNKRRQRPENQMSPDSPDALNPPRLNSHAQSQREESQVIHAHWQKHHEPPKKRYVASQLVKSHQLIL